jgi:hypothetical protein
MGPVRNLLQGSPGSVSYRHTLFSIWGKLTLISSRRILTDYGNEDSIGHPPMTILTLMTGFEGHPLRKDFPLTVT